MVIPGAAPLENDLDPLFQEFHVILYDVRHRGRSNSVLPAGEVGIPVELDDIEAVCNSFGVTSFGLIGWSYVGAEVALFARSTTGWSATDRHDLPDSAEGTPAERSNEAIPGAVRPGSGGP